MKLFVPVKQLTVHIPNTGATGHLFIILTNKCANGQHLLVPVCTQRKKFDRACLLGKGDHKFINDPSYIQYSNAALYESQILIKQVNSGVISYEGLLDEKVFAHVCNGVENSVHITPLHLEYYLTNKGN